MATTDISTKKVSTADPSEPPSSRWIKVSTWRLRGIGIVRIIFGLIWAIDAWFKWQPSFLDTMTSMLKDQLKGAPPSTQAWLTFWIHTVNLDPAFFAHLVAITETLLAIGLILGAFSNTIYVVGAALSLMIWSTAQGFGGPYGSGSVDIGASIIYAVVFAALFFANAGMYLGVDRRLTPALKRFGFLASGPINKSVPLDV
jgi:thiosulfate dehydrogenase [quinone] large subunit